MWQICVTLWEWYCELARGINVAEENVGKRLCASDAGTPHFDDALDARHLS